MKKKYINKPRSLKQKRKWQEKLQKERILHEEIMDAASDIIHSDMYYKTKTHIQHGNVTVNEHCMSVAKQSLSIALWFEKMGICVSKRELIRGALLHDYFLYDWHDPIPENRLHGFYHPGRALKNAMRDFDLTLVEQDIIKKHMWPLTATLPACRETWIVLTADKWVSTLETLGLLKGHGRHLRSLRNELNDSEISLSNEDGRKPAENDKTVFEVLRDYSQADYYPLHMPGHKRVESGFLSQQLASLDYTEISGFDNLHNPEGMLLRIQEKAQELMGSTNAFLLVNGSTCGVLAAISATVSQGGNLLMVRNAHKSAFYGAALRNINVDYLYPDIDTRLGFCEAITPEQVRKALKEKKYEAVFIVSPTYEGRVADVKGIAEVVHEKNIPLIVDEAHGAHLGLHSSFAYNSNQCGADLVIQSVHKTLPSLTQTALLHVNVNPEHNYVDLEKVKRYLHIYQTSSPSYILMASIENALDVVKEEKERLFSEFDMRYRQMLDHLMVCRNLIFIPKDDYDFKKQDIGKLIIGVPDGKGEWLLSVLHQKYLIDLEMAAGNYALAMFTISDTSEGYERLEAALLALDEELENTKKVAVSEEAMSDTNMLCPVNKRIDSVVSFGEAFESETVPVTLSESEGRIAGDFVFLYPPGAPVLVPGEMVTSEVISTILQCMKNGLSIQGLIPMEESELTKMVVEETGNTHFEKMRISVLVK